MPAIPVYGIVEKRCPHRRTKSRPKAYTGFSGRIARPLRGQFAADCAAKIFPFPLQALRPRGIVQGRQSLRTPMQALCRRRGDCTGAAAPTFPLQALCRPGGDCTGAAAPTFPLQALRPRRGDCTGAAAPTYPQCRRYAALGEIVQGRQPLPFPCRRSAPAGGIVQGRQPLRTPNAGAMPPSGRLYRGGSPYLSLAGAPPCTRVTFSPMRKSPKNLPEGAPSGYSPLGGRSRSPCGTAATPSKWCLRSPSFWGERR